MQEHGGTSRPFLSLRPSAIAATVDDFPDPFGPTTRLSAGPGSKEQSSYGRKFCILLRHNLNQRGAPRTHKDLRLSSKGENRASWPGNPLGTAVFVLPQPVASHSKPREAEPDFSDLGTPLRGSIRAAIQVRCPALLPRHWISRIIDHDNPRGASALRRWFVRRSCVRFAGFFHVCSEKRDEPACGRINALAGRRGLRDVVGGEAGGFSRVLPACRYLWRTGCS